MADTMLPLVLVVSAIFKAKADTKNGADAFSGKGLNTNILR